MNTQKVPYVNLVRSALMMTIIFKRHESYTYTGGVFNDNNNIVVRFYRPHSSDKIVDNSRRVTSAVVRYRWSYNILSATRRRRH